MNKNFLTTTEINELKSIKATFINDVDLTELQDFFKRYSMSFSMEKDLNTERTFKLIYENYNQLSSPQILRLYNTLKIDLTLVIKSVNDKYFQFCHTNDFDTNKFILNSVFDFSQYQIEKNYFTMVNKVLEINFKIGNTRI